MLLERLQVFLLLLVVRHRPMSVRVFYLDETCEMPADSQDRMASAVNQRVHLGVQMRSKPIKKINDPSTRLHATFALARSRGTGKRRRHRMTRTNATRSGGLALALARRRGIGKRR